LCIQHEDSDAYWKEENGIMLLHKNTGRKAQNAIRDNDDQGKMLKEHFANHLSMADTCMDLDEDGHTVTVM
jgi:hypothetical protein